MPDLLKVKLIIGHNTKREGSRDEKQKCPFHNYGPSNFLAKPLKGHPQLAREPYDWNGLQGQLAAMKASEATVAILPRVPLFVP